MKRFLTGIAVVMCASALSADPTSSIDLAGLNEMQRFYYEQGYQDARAKSFDEGYRQAKEEFIGIILPRYSQRIKALEAGKYLVDDGKITYPKVFRYKDKNGYSVHIEAPTVEKYFTEKDLYMLPEISLTKCEAPTAQQASIDASAELYGQNAFAIPTKDDVTNNRDTAPETRKEKVVVHLPYKNEGLVQALNSYNINYASTKDGFDLFFSNDAEKNDFCMKVTGNNTCTL
ncbi:MAG: hypothetical protein PHT07_10595 [Paludibacter sp.]|nr:hypothetical protein [Paludibacter sp.]